MILLLVATSAVLVTAGADVLVPSGASATSGGGVTAYVSPPFVQGPPGNISASIETFNSLSAGACNLASLNTSTSLGTFSGSCSIANGMTTAWGGATTTSDIPTVGGTASMYPTAPAAPGALTLTLSVPAQYVGFWWSAGSSGNTVKFYTAASAVTPIATFTTDTINTILGPANPTPYPGTAKVTALDGSQYLKSHYFGRPYNHTSLTPTASNTLSSMTNKESHAFLNVYASGSVAFTKVEFSGTGFEFDNIAVGNPLQGPPDNLVFIESVLGKSVEFRANGGTGSMPAQSSDTAANLTTNTYARPGWTFAGWHTDPAGLVGTAYADGASYNFSANLILYARWTPDNLTVTFDSQGGTSYGTASTTTGGSVASSPGTPTRAGYSFDGWFAALTGGSALSFPWTHGQTANFTIYARWTPTGTTTTVASSSAPSSTTTVAAPPTLAAAPSTTTSTLAVAPAPAPAAGSSPEAEASSVAEQLPATGGSPAMVFALAWGLAVSGLAVRSVRRRA